MNVTDMLYHALSEIFPIKIDLLIHSIIKKLFLFSSNKKMNAIDYNLQYT